MCAHFFFFWLAVQRENCVSRVGGEILTLAVREISGAIYDSAWARAPRASGREIDF